MTESNTSRNTDQAPPVETPADPFTGLSGVGPITEVDTQLRHEKGRWDVAFQWMGYALLAAGLILALVWFMPRG